MSRFYVPKENIRQNEIIVDGDEAHHIVDVMRMKDGDVVVIFDGTGNQYSGFIKKIDARNKKVIVEVVKVEKPSPENLPKIVLAQAIPKKQKMDYIVEKSTELGVERMIPLVTDRTIVRPDGSDRGKKVSRWEKIATVAAKQCGRCDVPAIDAIMDLKELAKSFDQYDIVLMACLTDKTVPLKEAIAGFKTGKVLVLIGPEGDFTPEEIGLLRLNNCKLVSLGKRVLKSDTAGLFVLSALGYEFS